MLVEVTLPVSISLLPLSMGWGLVLAAGVQVQAAPQTDRRGIDPSTPTAVLGAEIAEAPAPVEASPGSEDEPAVQRPVVHPEVLEPDVEPKPAWRGFQIASPDGRYSLAFGFLGQLRVTARDTEQTRPEGGVAVRLARPVLIANLWNGRVAMRLMPEFAGRVPSMLDATATVRAHAAFAVQVGQFRPWLSRSFRTGLPVLGLPGRGVIADRFRVDRDVGATVHGQPWDGKFEYYLGVFNGSGRDMTTLAPSPLLTARFVVAPVGAVPYVQTPYVRRIGPRSEQRGDAPSNALAVAIGGSAYTVANRESVTLPGGTAGRTGPRRRFGLSGDVVVSRRRMFALAEGFYERRDSLEDLGVAATNSWGAYAQAGVLAWSPFIDLTLRAGYVEDTTRTAPIEPGINAYVFGNDGKLQLAYRCDANAGGGAGGCVAHTGTLQAQLQF